MNSNNNINTGLASKVDSFRWNTDNKPHVIGVKTSAPDYSIPPTPASSYSNIHVVLDTIHPSSIVSRSQVLSGPTEVVSVSTFSTATTGNFNSSFSSLPTTSFQNNRLDEVPQPSSLLIPERIDPDQPLARSDAALTSLKSEIAPQTPGFVQLDEMDLSERKDRDLPASVDLSLYDETGARSYRSQKSKEWALMEEDERSWRMSREISSTWSTHWSRVQQELLGGSFNFAALEEQERSWRMSRNVDSTWLAQWKQVGKELMTLDSSISELTQWAEELSVQIEQQVGRIAQSLNDLKPELMKLKESLNETSYYRSLEEEERLWRMNRQIDSTWLAQWKSVGREIESYNINYDELSDWANGPLKADIEKSFDKMIDNLSALQSQLSFDRSYSLDLDALEEAERQYRYTRGVNSTFYQQWKLVGEEIKSFAGISWSEWFSNLKQRAINRTSKAVDRLENMELPSLPSVTLPSLPSVTLPSLPKIDLPDLKIGVVKSEATTPLYSDSELVDFTFRSHRVPREIIELEEMERQYRIQHGVNAVAYGLWFRAGLELKYRFSLQPTFAKYGESLVEKASTLADKAMDTVGSFVDSAQAAIVSAEESLTPVAPSEFPEHMHLNYFAFTAEKIDFTFKSRRTPAYIIAMEEDERSYRIMKYKSNRAAYKRWNKFLLDNLPKSNIEKAEGAFLTAVHKAEGFFGNLAHSVANTLHLNAEQTQEKDAKVDPMTAARVGRVNDELLHLTVKSV